MRFKAAVLCKHATADVAGEGPLPAMRLQMNLQVAGRLETLPAELTAVRPVHSVVLLVRAQLSDGAESQATEHARAWNGGSMRLEVFAKRVYAGHRGPARHARQRVFT